MEIQKIPIGRLNPAMYNPRVDLKPGDKEYEKLKRSITEFGYVEPIIWNRHTGNVIGGHQRLKVLADLGHTNIDCVVVDLDIDHEKALNIALNRIQGDWDETKLAAIMADFDASTFDVSLTGFDANEVDALLNRFYSHEAVEDDFDAEQAEKEIKETGGPSAQYGNAWSLGDHILICGDVADQSLWKEYLPGEYMQLAITFAGIDPKEYMKEGIDPWKGRMATVIRTLSEKAEIICWQIGDLAKTGSLYMEPMQVHSMQLFAESNLRPLWMRVWQMGGTIPHGNAVQSVSDKPAEQFEYITAFGTDAEATDLNDSEYSWLSAFAGHAHQFVRRLTREERRNWGYAGVWEIASGHREKDQKPLIPIELPWRCIKMHSDLHGRVLDPLAGYGSTLIACEQSGRRCRAFDPDPVNIDLIIRRWEQFTGEKAVML